LKAFLNSGLKMV